MADDDAASAPKGKTKKLRKWIARGEVFTRARLDACEAAALTVSPTVRLRSPAPGGRVASVPKDVGGVVWRVLAPRLEALGGASYEEPASPAAAAKEWPPSAPSAERGPVALLYPPRGRRRAVARGPAAGCHVDVPGALAVRRRKDIRLSERGRARRWLDVGNPAAARRLVLLVAPDVPLDAPLPFLRAGGVVRARVFERRHRARGPASTLWGRGDAAAGRERGGSGSRIPRGRDRSVLKRPKGTAAAAQGRARRARRDRLVSTALGAARQGQGRRPPREEAQAPGRGRRRRGCRGRWWRRRRRCLAAAAA